jgi:aryl-alcohol dehydrogenase-like predicted oxidoreductase
VNLRLSSAEASTPASIEAAFGVLAELQQKGLIKHLGISNVSSEQVTEAQRIAPVVAIQNLYNVANRQDDELVARAAREHIAFVPFFPLGGFNPLQSDVLRPVASRVGASPQQVALAWLLQRSRTMAVIPGTSSRAHLRENMAAVELTLPPDAIENLNGIGPKQ